MNRVRETGGHWQYLPPKGSGKRQANSVARARAHQDERAAETRFDERDMEIFQSELGVDMEIERLYWEYYQEHVWKQMNGGLD